MTPALPNNALDQTGRSCHVPCDAARAAPILVPQVSDVIRPGKKLMQRYSLEEVMSGTEESCLWVTLGFSSDLEASDRLHIVCATTVDAQDREGGMADLYLERFDQAYSCYGGAELVLVTPSSVEARLNKKGIDALDFEGHGVAFDVPAGLAAYEDAMQILRKMAGLECGRKMRVEPPG